MPQKVVISVSPASGGGKQIPAFGQPGRNTACLSLPPAGDTGIHFQPAGQICSYFIIKYILCQYVLNVFCPACSAALHPGSGRSAFHYEKSPACGCMQGRAGRQYIIFLQCLISSFPVRVIFSSLQHDGKVPDYAGPSRRTPGLSEAAAVVSSSFSASCFSRLR